MGSLQATNNNPKRSLRLIFQLLHTIFKSHPSGMSPSKKGKKVLEVYSSFLFGKVRLTEVECSFSKYSSSY